MKKLLLLLVAAGIAVQSHAQAPQQIAYQAILRDNLGTIQGSTTATLGIAILQGSSSGTVVYEETHAVTSNNFGLVNVSIGAGNVVSGSMAAINWAVGPYFVRTSLDGTVMGTSPLLSVPYALHAATSDTPGPAGPQGPQGAAGPQGATGAQGPAGADGTGVTILGTLNNVSDLPANGSPGDSYMIGGSLYVWSGTTNTWNNVGAIQGPQGPTGATGAAGAQGPAGPAGATGAMGPQGPAGPVGATGAMGAAGPQGPAGPTGATGAAGAQGPAGPVGATGAAGTDGKAVLNGTGNPATGTGTVGDFYINTSSNTLFGPKTASGWGTGTSLVGPQGATGAAGAAGPQGPAGPVGATGAMGAAGPQGPAGPTGATGAAGAQGPAGPAGATGAMGPQGPVGPVGATGAAGTDGKAVLNGTGNPATDTGTVGDFYINTSNNTLFGPKTASGWGTNVSLVGPQGPAGQDGGANGWSLTGNAGTSSSNFIGTTDNVDFIVKVNNRRSGWISPVGTNTSWGYTALSPTSTGSGNTAIGAGPLYANTSGYNNTGLGTSAMASNTAGVGNTGIGYSVLLFNTSGNNNAAMGINALMNNTTGNSNVAVGIRALYRNTTRSNIVAVGDSALYNNGLNAQPDNSIEGIYEAHDNTALGSKALLSNQRGSSNTATGFRSLYYNSTGSANTGIGTYALNNSITGNSNTGVGISTLTNVGSGSYNTAIGAFSGIPGGNNTLSYTGAFGYVATPTATGRINIGTSTNNNLTGGYGAWQNLSDGRFKRNVHEDVPGLAFITKLRPVTYNLDAVAVETFSGTLEKLEKDGTPDERAKFLARLQEVSQEKLTGFIAQEVDQAAKEAGYDFDGVQHPNGERDHYTLGYATFVVPLVKAVQEQQAQIEHQQRQIEEMRKEIDGLKKR